MEKGNNVYLGFDKDIWQREDVDEAFFSDSMFFF